MSAQKPEPIVFETYENPNRIVRTGEQDKPSHLNNEIRVQRFRVTIEVIEESDDVIRDRLLALDAERGHVDKHRCIKAEAKRLGIDLTKR